MHEEFLFFNIYIPQNEALEKATIDNYNRVEIDRVIFPKIARLMKKLGKCHFFLFHRALLAVYRTVRSAFVLDTDDFYKSEILSDKRPRLDETRCAIALCISKSCSWIVKQREETKRMSKTFSTSNIMLNMEQSTFVFYFQPQYFI